MEFKFDIKKALRWNANGVFIMSPRNEQRTKETCEIIDVMGRESSRAQSLRSVITTSSRFFSSSDNKIYLKSEGNKVVGILKTGSRKLFYTDEIGKILELSPVCLLDFYVHESYQRSGYGKELYEIMLEEEKTSPSKIAIDRPSQKLIAFMRKHYSLSDYIPQNNNFVVYRQYFAQSERSFQRGSEESKTCYRPATQERKIVNERRESGQERSPGAMVNSERKMPELRSLEKNVESRGVSKPENRGNYAPIPPWATTTKFTTPNTTSSQYGNHQYRK